MWLITKTCIGKISNMKTNHLQMMKHCLCIPIFFFAVIAIKKKLLKSSKGDS